MVKFTEDAKKSGFTVMEEGIHILKLDELKPIRQAGKLTELKMTASNKQGEKVWNRYTMDERKSWFGGSQKALYSLLSTGCGLKPDENDEINEADAVGKYFVAEIRHAKGNDDRVFVNLGWIKGHVDSFDADISKFSDDFVQDDAADDAADGHDDDPYS